ncbi:MAG: hypothetical protein KIT69_06020 [Propionibacteriaceae bacterium]|nr:hypothetical protein [Propionibacteriaceae bacterium]
MLTDADRALMRADAHMLLPDRCEIRQPDSIGVDDQGHETRISGAVAIQWQGKDQIPCTAVRVGTDVTTYTTTVGGQEVDSRRYIIRLPWEVGTVPVGLVVTLVATHSTYLLGRRLSVDSVGGRSNDVLRSVLAVDNLDP